MEQYRKSPRARFLDYNGGEYFVTICTHDRKHYFGKIVDGEMILSKIGNFVDVQLRRSGEFSEHISVPIYVVMPNHIHLIVSIGGPSPDSGDPKFLPTPGDKGFEQRTPNPNLRADSMCQRHIPMLSKYISSLKGAVTKFAKSSGCEFCWQSRFHDHFIRGPKDRSFITEYILNNVAKWHDDCFNDDEV